VRDAIDRLLRDPAERARLGRNARHAVETEYSLDNYVQRLGEQLMEIASADLIPPPLPLPEGEGREKATPAREGEGREKAPPAHEGKGTGRARREMDSHVGDGRA
jgi:hypothetical protein